ncbi:MAG TPA: hypothetical protein ENJ19_03140 [Gammaproteobacteria bacterium]|nr:hypothetical protein [Gammaproteobacteria bacterium]
MTSASKLLARHRGPQRRYLAILAWALLVPVGWGAFEIGRYQAGFDILRAREERDALMEAVESWRRQAGEMRQQVANLKEAREVDRQAYSEVERSLKDLQDEVLELKEEAAFYRGLVSPSQAAQGIRVQRLKLTPSGNERGYAYELVLSQVSKGARVTRGFVHLLVQGLQDGASRELSLADMAASVAKIKFRFKYFQAAQGDIILPENFVPTRVVVRIDMDRPKRQRIEKAFVWQEVTS